MFATCLTADPKVAHGLGATDLYDPLAMPAPLLKAHQQLDRAVDRCYRPEPFPSDRHRVEYLFALYERLTTPLVAAARPERRRRKLPAMS
jgi:hypothetical protein